MSAPILTASSRRLGEKSAATIGRMFLSRSAAITASPTRLNSHDTALVVDIDFADGGQEPLAALKLDEASWHVRRARR